MIKVGQASACHPWDRPMACHPAFLNLWHRPTAHHAASLNSRHRPMACHAAHLVEQPRVNFVGQAFSLPPGSQPGSDLQNRDRKGAPA
jgi:hypothetical protein